jgi:septum formation protein
LTGVPFWIGPEPLLLASTSAARRAVLEGAGIPVQTEASGVDERAIERELRPGVGAETLALRLARAKAEAVASRHPDRLVLGADQVLSCDGELYGKPGSPERARKQLRKLAGRLHVLHSAVVIMGDGAEDAFVTPASLTVRPLDPAAIALYVEGAGDAALHSAGGYLVEGLGIHLFSAIDGDHSTVLGLPLLPTLAALRRRGRLRL